MGAILSAGIHISRNGFTKMASASGLVLSGPSTGAGTGTPPVHILSLAATPTVHRPPSTVHRGPEQVFKYTQKLRSCATPQAKCACNPKKLEEMKEEKKKRVEVVNIMSTVAMNEVRMVRMRAK
jgi:hypothetical protein